MTSKIGLPPLLDNDTQLVLRRRLFTQLAAFTLLELAFIVLAVVCLRIPLPCSISSSPTLTRAILTAVFIIWQMIATMCARSVIFHVFSSEWFSRFDETGKLAPGYTDMVSTPTSRHLDRLRYFFGRSCSLSYRLSFITSIVLTALASLAPGSINAKFVQRFQPSIIPITNFTATGGNFKNSTMIQTGLVAELELRQNTTFKFTTEEHVIVGWPNVEVGQIMGDMKFRSDVLLYNTTCWWEAPSCNTSQGDTTWYAGGFAWHSWATPKPDTVFDGGIMSMYRFSTDSKFSGDFPEPLHAVEPLGLQGYLFLGHNTSLPKVSSEHRELNLDGLPTIFNSSGYHFFDAGGTHGYFKSPLATFLLCDPHARILDGQVLLSRKNTSLTLLSTSPPVNSQPIVGNISPDAANFVLGLSMMDVLKVDDEEASMRIGALAARVFTKSTSQGSGAGAAGPFDIGLLPIEDIQRNLDSLVNSGGKALSSYIKNSGVEGTNELSLTLVAGTIEQDKLVLVTSQGLMIAIICLFFCAALLLIVNLFFLRVWQMPPFDLETLTLQIQRQDNEKNTVTRTLLVPALLQDVPESNRPSPRKLLPRLLAFIILELAFLSLVLSCTKNPILVNIPLSSAEVQGGFTVLFILWHTFAIFLLSDAISFAFSSEWSRQYAKTGHLDPGVTDRVSRLTSGNEDRIRHLLTSRSSTTFRFAFLTFLILTTLNIFAPGSLSVSKMKVAVDTPLKIADLRPMISSQSDENDNNMNFLQDRANSLTILELREGSPFKYDMEPNWIVPWPDETSIDPTVVGDVEYPTDVIHFNYSCTWKVPEMVSRNGTTTWIINDHQWEVYGNPKSNSRYVGGIVPLYRPADVQPDAVIATLIFGTNGSLPVDHSIINLNHLPTLFHPHGLTLNTSNGTPSKWLSPLSTILVCDPRIELSGGRAQLTPSKQLSVVTSQLNAVGNIPNEAVTTIFSRALSKTLDTADKTVNRWIGFVSAQTFLTDTSMNFTAFPHGVPVQDLTTLNNNFNNLMLAGSKAFLDGLYVDPSDKLNVTVQMGPVIGRGEVEKQALIGDLKFGVVAMCLLLASMILFAILIHLILVDVGRTFELKYLIPIIRAQQNESFLYLD